VRLISVELENIKSYRRATVDLGLGVNAICGLNGSGKTTILEAIGFALFDSLPYNQAAFLREGEKSGTVRVRVLAYDEREYEVVRKVGSGATHYVADVESGTRIAERAETLTWIREHALRMEGEADLPALFENAVGVPQGTMTAAFLQATKARQGIFDPLLGVEEYRAAFERLLETVNHVSARLAVVREAIARLEGETQRIPEIEGLLEARERDLDALESEVASLQDRLELAETRLKAFDEERDRLAALRLTVESGERQVQLWQDMLRQAEERAEEARQARAIVAETEAAYRQVITAREELARLDQTRAERDRLVTQKIEASTAADKTNLTIEKLGEQLQAAVTAGEEAASMGDAVERQESLEERRREIEGQQKELARIEHELADTKHELDSASQRAAEASRKIELAAAAAERAALLPERRARLDELRQEESELKTVAMRREDREREGLNLRTRVDRLAANRDRLAEIRDQMKLIEILATATPALRERERELHERMVQIDATLQYQSVAIGALERGQCPLLELACPVVTADGTLLKRVRSEDLREEREELERDLEEVMQDLAEGEKAEKQYRQWEGAIGPLEQSVRELAELEPELERIRAEYASLSDRLKRRPEIEREMNQLQAELGRLEADQSAAGALVSLREQEEQATERVRESREKIGRLEGERAPLTKLADELAVVTDELSALGDPRVRRQDLLAIAGRREALEAERQRLQDDLQAETDRLRALVAALQPYAELDRALAEQQGIISRLQNDHDRYLQHERTAAEVEARGEKVQEAARRLGEAESELEEHAKAFDAAARDYDAAAHDEASEELKHLRGDEAKLGERRKHVQEDIDGYRRELDGLRVTEARLQRSVRERVELEETLETVKFVRKTIKEAGPIVTKTLLDQISAIANDFFAELMDDHAAELRWEENYEIVVQRGTEVRKFAQLSGGEQMSAALAIRLALLREMSGIDVAFFDEPTQNMDADRRGNLADQIAQVRGFEQLVVISHDDTFEHQTDTVIRLRKERDETIVEVG